MNSPIREERLKVLQAGGKYHSVQRRVWSYLDSPDTRDQIALAVFSSESAGDDIGFAVADLVMWVQDLGDDRFIERMADAGLSPDTINFMRHEWSLHL